MKKILVTGGAGFIGSHVCDNLIERGYEVLTFDRHLIYGKADTLIGDIKDFEAVYDAVSKCDGVIHLAGRLGTAETIKTPLSSVEVNIIGSLNVFEAVKQLNKKAVYISVGNYFMNNAYSITKNTAERFALMYNKEFGTQIAVVRGLNAYGERQKHKPVKKMIPNFILKALKKEPIEIYGDGEQIMDLIYVKDLAEILVRALILDHYNYYKVMDAGTGNRLSVNTIAKTINSLAGNEKGIDYLPMRQGEPEKSVVLGNPDTLKPLGKINFTPLEVGLLKTIEWYKKNVL